MNTVPLDTASSPYASYGWSALAVVVAVLALIGLWIWMKGRRLPGEHVYPASRLAKGNRLFPAQMVITPQSLTLYKPSWIGKTEESIHMAHVASVKIATHVIFSDICVETSGGQNPIRSNGHTKSDAVRVKELLEKFQSEYYRSKPTA
jgi:hypothetical protein